MAVRVDKLNQVSQARLLLEYISAAPATNWDRIPEVIEILQQVWGESKEVCPKCNGEGQTFAPILADGVRSYYPCPKCNGTGEVSE